MGLQNLRMFNNPTNGLFRRDVRSQIVQRASTGRFARNMVLDGYFHENSVPIPMYLQTADFVDARTFGCPTALYGEVVCSTDTGGARRALNPRFSSGNGYWSSATPTDSYLGFKSNIQRIVSKISLISYVGYSPNTIRVQGSNNGSTWTTLLETTIDTAWDTSYTPKDFDIPLETQNLYSYYRLYIVTGNDDTVRIYNVRFFIRDIDPTELDVVCNAENPLILTFADGYDVENMPVDYVATVTTPTTLTVNDVLTQWPLLTVERIRSQTWALYAEYNPADGSVAFKFDRKSYDDSLDWTYNYAVVPPYENNAYYSVINGLSASHIIGNGFKLSAYGTGQLDRYRLAASNPVYTSTGQVLGNYNNIYVNWAEIRKEDSSQFYLSGYYLWVLSGGSYCTYEYLSVDDIWISLSGVYDFSPKTNVFMFNSPTPVKAFRIRSTSGTYSASVKYNIFSPSLIEHKQRWQDGSFQKYISDEDRWEKIYRVYMGVVGFDSNNNIYLNHYENNLTTSFDRLDLAAQLL